MTIARVLPILLVLLPFGAAGQPVTVALTDQAVPAEFIERVNAYAEIHRIATELRIDHSDLVSLRLLHKRHLPGVSRE